MIYGKHRQSNRIDSFPKGSFIFNLLNLSKVALDTLSYLKPTMGGYTEVYTWWDGNSLLGGRGFPPLPHQLPNGCRKYRTLGMNRE